MANVLMFPGVYAKKKNFVNPIRTLINKIKNYQQKSYERKVQVLKEAAYKYYLKELESMPKNGVEIPYCLTAKQLAEAEVKKVEKKGRKHIESCYKDLIKNNPQK